MPVHAWGIGRLAQPLTEQAQQTFPMNSGWAVDTEWFLLDPPLPQEHMFDGRAWWKPTGDDGVVLRWGGFSTLRVSLSP